MVFFSHMRFHGASVRLTISWVLPEIFPEVAVMVTSSVLGVTVVTTPVMWLTAATDAFDEVQMTMVVISWVVPSEYMPVALNCGLNPTGISIGFGIGYMWNLERFLRFK